MERALPPLTARDPVRAGFGPQVMKGIDHLNILVGTSQLLLVVFAPIWFMYEGREIMFGHGLDHLSSLEVCRRRAFGVCARARARSGVLCDASIRFAPPHTYGSCSLPRLTSTRARLLFVPPRESQHLRPSLTQDVVRLPRAPVPVFFCPHPAPLPRRPQAGDMFFWLLMASICNCAQTIIAFTFLSLVQPVTYSVANVSKRIVVISAAILSEALTTGVLPPFLNVSGGCTRPALRAAGIATRPPRATAARGAHSLQPPRCASAVPLRFIISCGPVTCLACNCPQFVRPARGHGDGDFWRGSVQQSQNRREPVSAGPVPACCPTPLAPTCAPNLFI